MHLLKDENGNPIPHGSHDHGACHEHSHEGCSHASECGESCNTGEKCKNETVALLTYMQQHRNSSSNSSSEGQCLRIDNDMRIRLHYPGSWRSDRRSVGHNGISAYSSLWNSMSRNFHCGLDTPLLEACRQQKPCCRHRCNAVSRLPLKYRCRA